MLRAAVCPPPSALCPPPSALCPLGPSVSLSPPECREEVAAALARAQSPTPPPATAQAHIDAHPEFIQPTSRRNEIRERLRNDPLRDLSVSRTTFSWGIPVPDDPKHVMYVWFDALSNYLSGIDHPDGPVS